MDTQLRRSAPKRQPARKPARRAAIKLGAVTWLVRKLREATRGRVTMILFIAMLGVFIHDVFGERGFLAMRRSQKEVQKLQQEIDKINADNSELAGQVKALKTDPKLIERMAREQMNLARPGEVIFKLPAPPEEPAPAQQSKK